MLFVDYKIKVKTFDENLYFSYEFVFVLLFCYLLLLIDIAKSEFFFLQLDISCTVVSHSFPVTFIQPYSYFLIRSFLETNFLERQFFLHDMTIYYMSVSCETKFFNIFFSFSQPISKKRRLVNLFVILLTYTSVLRVFLYVYRAMNYDAINILHFLILTLDFSEDPLLTII